MRRTVKRLHLACALFLLGLVGPAARAGTSPADVPPDVARLAGRLQALCDEASRRAALEKLGQMDIQIGYPAKWVEFSGLDICPDDHFGNVQRAGRFAFQREATNSIDITAAILQPPFYEPGADVAVNHCAIGAVIGHEITHGFDSLGRQFDPQGKLRNGWSGEADRRFEQRTDVLVDPYNRYEILPGLMHNGAMTVTENTADLGGITLAREASSTLPGDAMWRDPRQRIVIW